MLLNHRNKEIEHVRCGLAQSGGGILDGIDVNSERTKLSEANRK